MPDFPKSILFGFATGVLGLFLFFSFNVAGYDLEESIGLNLLFRLRKTRAAPSDVVIVSLDKSSADYFKLSPEPRKWPRSMHARLTEILTERGTEIAKYAVELARHNGRKTVKEGDVKLASQK